MFFQHQVKNEQFNWTHFAATGSKFSIVLSATISKTRNAKDRSQGANFFSQICLNKKTTRPHSSKVEKIIK